MHFFLVYWLFYFFIYFFKLFFLNTMWLCFVFHFQDDFPFLPKLFLYLSNTCPWFNFFFFFFLAQWHYCYDTLSYPATKVSLFIYLIQFLSLFSFSRSLKSLFLFLFPLFFVSQTFPSFISLLFFLLLVLFPTLRLVPSFFCFPCSLLSKAGIQQDEEKEKEKKNKEKKKEEKTLFKRNLLKEDTTFSG